MTDQAQHAAVPISDEQLQEWSDNRADDAGRLARELLPLRRMRIHAVNGASLSVGGEYPPDTTLPYPETLTPELRGILGIMIFQSAPIAHQLRRLGHDIPEKTEAEQAYVLHWFIRLALQHGDRWSYVWEDEMRRMTAEQKAASGTQRGTD